MEKEDSQYRKMTEEPVPKLVVALAVPTVISMLITSIYNVVDTFFVAKLGRAADFQRSYDERGRREKDYRCRLYPFADPLGA